MPKVYNKRDKNAPPGAVYVGRPSKWGNPFVIGVHGDRDKVVKLFRILATHIATPWWQQGETLSIDFQDAAANQWKLTFTEDDIRELKGKDLVCWCAPKPCHADILLKLANEATTQRPEGA